MRQLFNVFRADPGSDSKLFLLMTDAYNTYAIIIENLKKRKHKRKNRAYSYKERER